MIKVLQILTDSNIGGAGRLLINYLHNFDKNAFSMQVLLPRGAALKPLVEAEGYPVVEMEHGRDKSFDMPAVREIRAAIRAFQPDIVHCHSSFSGKVAAWQEKVPGRFYTRHCAFPQPRRLTTFPGKQINGAINNRLATHIVAVAAAARDNLTETGVDPRKITIIINGVEPMRRTTAAEQDALRRSLAIPSNAFVCGISARLESYKGHEYLLRALALLRETHPNVVCLCIGDGTYRAHLETLAASLGIDPMVRFTGFVDDVAPYYNILQLNLNCSIGTETSSLALSEGMSLALPAIASDFGGNPYMITDGVNGLIVPQKDPSALAAAMARVIDDPALLARLSAGAEAAYHEKFTAAAMTAQLESLYRDAVH